MTGKFRRANRLHRLPRPGGRTNAPARSPHARPAPCSADSPPLGNAARRTRTYRPVLEALEDRCLLSGRGTLAFDPGTGTLTITGGSARVAMGGSGALAVTVAGQLYSAGATTLHAIELDGGAADALTLDNLAGTGLAIRSGGAIAIAGNVRVRGALDLHAAGLIDVEAGAALTASCCRPAAAGAPAAGAARAFFRRV
jgi:hypothetical protein